MKNLLFILFCVIFRGTGVAETLPWTETARTDGQMKGIKALSDGSVAFFGEISKEINSNTPIQNIGVLKNGAITQLGNGLPAGVNDICQMVDGTIYAVGKFPGGVAKLSTGNTTWQVLTLTSNDPLGFKFVEAINADELLVGMEGDSVNGVRTGTVFIYNTETKTITPKPINGWPTKFAKMGNKIAITYFKPFGDLKNFALFNIQMKDWETITNIPATADLRGVTFDGPTSLYVFGTAMSDFETHIWSYDGSTWTSVGIAGSDFSGLNFVNGKLYATGPITTFMNNSSFYDPGWIYDPTVKSWAPSEMSMPPGVKWMFKSNESIYAGTNNGYIHKTSIPTSIKTNIADEQLLLFPNPAKDLVTIMSLKTLTIPLFALNGQILQTLQLEKGENQISLDVAPGIYIVGQTKLVIQ